MQKEAIIIKSTLMNPVRKLRYSHSLDFSDVGSYIKVEGQVVLWRAKTVPCGWDGVNWSFKTWVSNCLVHQSTVLQTMYLGSIGLIKNFLPLPIRRTSDSAARSSQNFSTRASYCRDQEVWLKSFKFKSFFARKIIILHSIISACSLKQIFFFPSGSELAFQLLHSVLQLLFSFSSTLCNLLRPCSF